MLFIAKVVLVLNMVVLYNSVCGSMKMLRVPYCTCVVGKREMFILSGECYRPLLLLFAISVCIIVIKSYIINNILLLLLFPFCHNLW